MAFFVYIVANIRTKAIYIGHTDDLVRRAIEHKEARIDGWAKENGCTRLIWYCEFPNRLDAKIRERQMKKWKRAWKLREISTLNADWQDMLIEYMK